MDRTYSEEKNVPMGRVFQLFSFCSFTFLFGDGHRNEWKIMIFFYWNSNHNSFVNRVACNGYIHFWSQLNHQLIVSESIDSTLLLNVHLASEMGPELKRTFQIILILLFIYGNGRWSIYICTIHIHIWLNENIEILRWMKPNNDIKWRQVEIWKGDQMMICRNEKKY